MKVAFYTLGCKVNQYETNGMIQAFLEKGYELVDFSEKADIYIINTCTVTSISDKKSRQMIRRTKQLNLDAIVVAVGCYAQVAADKLEEIKDIDLILGISEKTEIVKYVEEALANKQPQEHISDVMHQKEFVDFGSVNYTDKNRVAIKVQDGCNQFCSYCIIPYARGRVRSKPLEDILFETKNLAQKGYKEIVLVGINLSAYGTDIGINLCDAIEKVCSVEGIKRVRLGSLEPEQMDEITIKRLSKQKKLCPQFHLSLQSGCNETLKRMNRHYTAEEYFTIVQNLRKHFKNASITTDVMVGFAGETEEEFEKSLNFVKKVEFSKVHVFAYSVRSGTRAAEFENQVEPNKKKRRSQIMIDEAAESRIKFLNSQVGKIEPVLYERRDKNGFFEGYTSNYTPVKINVNEKLDLHSKIILTELMQAESDYCLGRIADELI